MNNRDRLSEVAGFCPMGCGQTLVLGGRGMVMCIGLSCPRPMAAHEILADPQKDHIINTTYTDYSLMHPLHERLDEQLLNCALTKHLDRLNQPPVVPGRYWVHWVDDDWVWEPRG